MIGEGLHLLDDLHPGDVVPWRGVRWVVHTIKGTVLTLRDPDTGKRKRLDWNTGDVERFYLDMESLWNVTKPHCYGQAHLCGWCTAGLFADADTERGGAIASLPWHKE